MSVPVEILVELDCLELDHARSSAPTTDVELLPKSSFNILYSLIPTSLLSLSPVSFIAVGSTQAPVFFVATGSAQSPVSFVAT